jgi:serine protease Do
MTMLRSFLVSFAAMLLASAAAAIVAAAPPAALNAREEAAFRAAAAAVAPSVVSIETIGGLDSVGELLIGSGPSSGVIVSDDGYIASSTFNFVHRPASIIATLPDGTRLPAKLVGRDEARKLVLLKVDAPHKLPVPTAVPESETAVGQWSIAVGRSYDFAQANVSVGVVSALRRIWGKALQTDAKISPANYGGALADVRGRVYGVLVPLSPNEHEDVSGVEWYDSGIGFAVPLAHIEKILPRLKAGETLKPGLIGVRFKGRNVYADPPHIVKARAGAPAYEAGLRDDDRVVAVDGRPVAVQAQVMEALQSRYAGDTVKFTIARGDQRLDFAVKLVDRLDPYARPFLGILAERSAEPGTGARVRFVYADSPAAKAGVLPGDELTKFNGVRVRSRDELRTAVAELEVGKTATVEVVRGGMSQTFELTTVADIEQVPAKLSDAAQDAIAPPGAAKAEAVAIKIPELEEKAELFVPPGYDEAVPHGLVVLFHPQGGFSDRAVVERLRDQCRAANLLLLVPYAVDGKWTAQSLDFVQKAIDRTAGDYRVDAARVAALGYEEGGVVALRSAAQFRDRIRGVATINTPSLGFAAETDPREPTSFYIAFAGDLKGKARIETAVEQLRKQKYPVVIRALKNGADDCDAAAAAELLRWLDVLDRI